MSMEVLQFCDIGWAWLRDMHVVNKVARPSALFWSKYVLNFTMHTGYNLLKHCEQKKEFSNTVLLFYEYEEV